MFQMSSSNPGAFHDFTSGIDLDSSRGVVSEEEEKTAPKKTAKKRASKPRGKKPAEGPLFASLPLKTTAAAAASVGPSGRDSSDSSGDEEDKNDAFKTGHRLSSVRVVGGNKSKLSEAEETREIIRSLGGSIYALTKK